MSKLEVGTVLVSSWGYDQTNIDFYEVVKRTAKTVEVRPIRRKVQPKGWCQDIVEPLPGSFSGEAFRRKIKDFSRDGNDPFIDINSFAFAHVWDGKPKLETSWA